jgi:hypothetical protein
MYTGTAQVVVETGSNTKRCVQALLLLDYDGGVGTQSRSPQRQKFFMQHSPAPGHCAEVLLKQSVYISGNSPWKEDPCKHNSHSATAPKSMPPPVPKSSPLSPVSPAVPSPVSLLTAPSPVSLLTAPSPASPTSIPPVPSPTSITPPPTLSLISVHRLQTHCRHE